jgi:PAS domain S-box-containing protein
MNSKKKPVVKSDPTKLKKRVLRDSRPLPEGHRVRVPGDITERKRAEEALRASEEKWRSIFEILPVGVSIVSSKHLVMDTNPALSQILELSKEDLLKGKFKGRKYLRADRTLMPPQEFPSNRVVKEQKIIRDVEIGIEKEDGIVIWTNVSATPLAYGSGSAIVTVDITERKQAEEALRESEERFRSILDNIEDGYYEVDTAGNLTFFNPALVRMLGRPASELMGMNNRLYMTPEGVKAVFQTFNRVFRTVIPEQATDWELVRPDGTRRSVEASVSPIKVANGSINGFRGIVRDVTERKQMEKKVEEERILLRTLIDNLPDRIYVMDVLGRKIISNIADWQASGGKAMEDVIGKTDFDTYPPELAEDFWALDKSVIDTGISVINREEPGLDSQGNRVSVLSSKVPLRDVQGNVIGLVGIGRDISERKRAEQALAIQARIASIFGTLPDEEMFNEVLKVILEVMHSPFGVFGYLDENGDWVMPTMTRQVWDNCNVPEKTIRYPRETWGDSSWPRALREKRTICSNEPSIKIPEGHVSIQRHISMPILFQGEAIGLFQVANKETDYSEADIRTLADITGTVAPLLSARLRRERAEEQIRQLNAELEQRVEERTRELRQAQEQLVRKEKLAVLGELAGAMGHELRNPLGVISTAVYYLKLVQPDAGDKVREYHAMLEKEVHNAEKIISDLLDFARLESMQREPVAVLDLLQRVLVHYPVPETVTTALQVPPDLPMVFADPPQVERVLGNLVINACEAMVSQKSTGTMSPQAGSTTGVASGGKLTISARRQKGMVSIAVKDTGVGIPPENMSKLFEPLFTTRAKGIGLGLAVSQKLAEANGGRIEVKSKPGKGSTFTVWLPAHSHMIPNLLRDAQNGETV